MENKDKNSENADHECRSESEPMLSMKRGRGRPRKPRPSVFPASEIQESGKTDASNDESSPEKNTATGMGLTVVLRKRERPPKSETENSSSEPKRRGGRQKDSTKSNVTCEICGKFFKFRATLKQHEQIHYGIKEFECEFCHKRFLHKGTLKVHLRLHTGEMPYKCPHCPKRFRGQTALDCHIFRHTKQGTKCPQCSSIFATPSIVKQHIREVHTTERSHTCQICGVTYKHRKSLRLHLRNHQKRVCPDCGKVFHSIYAMMTHRKVHAQDRFQFKCSYCDRKFEKEDELESHNKLRGRAFQCDMCCHSFNKESFLQNHNRRNHWKALGLEQLKVAAPKNGWNRKGVPKVKKTIPGGVEANVEMVGHNDHSYETIGSTDPIDNWSNLGQAAELSYIVHNPSQMVQQCDSQNTLVSIDYNMLERNFSQSMPKVTTVTTQIEPYLPPNDDLISSCNNTFQDIDQQERAVSEANDDCSVDDFCAADDAGDSDLEAGSKLFPEDKQEHLKQEEPSRKSDFLKEEDVEQVNNTQLNEAIAEIKLCGADMKQNDSDSDEEVPLADLYPKISSENSPAHQSDVGEIPQETNPLSIKKERLESEDDFDDGADDEDKSFLSEGEERSNSSDEMGDNHDRKTRIYTRRLRRRVVSEKKIDEPIPRKKTYSKREMICSFCGEYFKGRNALKEHKLSVHPDMKGNCGPFVCELCGKSYATAASMVVHRGSHEAFQRYKCDECPRAFTYRCYLESHRRAEHLRERLVCPLCGKQFKYSQDLKVHSKQHEDEKPFKCDQCPSAFRYPSALRCHKALHVETVFTCDICSKNFKYANSLRVHKRLHTGVKRFRCEICDREFHTKAPLVRHLATHSVERELKCVVCDKIFYKKIELIIHQTKEHPNHPMIGKTVKIHTCPVCGQEFTKKSNLKSHSYIHGDEYKYKCDICEDQKFKQHAGLRHHLIHHHKLEVRKRKPKDEEREEGSVGKAGEEEVQSTTDATLTPAVSVVHNGVEFIVQRIQFE